MEYVKDAFWLALIVLLLPLLMLLALGTVVTVVGRHLYWWARDYAAVATRDRESA